MLVELVDAVQMTDLDIQILIADNGLGEPTLGALRELGAAIVPMGTNRGFAAAVNRAVARAEGEVLALLNDDLVPRAGFLSALVEPVANGAVMAAGVLLQYDRTHLIESAGVEVDTTFGAHDYLRDEPVEILERPLPPPLSPCGAAAAYRLDAFRSVGGFDEGFFAYFEDLDLTLRLRAEGGSCALAPTARAVHLGLRRSVTDRSKGCPRWFQPRLSAPEVRPDRRFGKGWPYSRRGSSCVSRPRLATSIVRPCPRKGARLARLSRTEAAAGQRLGRRQPAHGNLAALLSRELRTSVAHRAIHRRGKRVTNRQRAGHEIRPPRRTRRNSVHESE